MISSVPHDRTGESVSDAELLRQVGLRLGTDYDEWCNLLRISSVLSWR
jgi:hypothetical protein